MSPIADQEYVVGHRLQENGRIKVTTKDPECCYEYVHYNPDNQYTPKDAIRDLQTTQAVYDAIYDLWIRSASSGIRLGAFEAATNNLPQINRIVCTGIGDFTQYHVNLMTFDFDSPYDRRAPFFQLAELEIMINHLRNKGHPLQDCEIYFQEPVFNSVDKAFITSRGFQVVENPEVFNLMTPSTFFYAPKNTVRIVYYALQMEIPALYAGTDVQWIKRIEPDEMNGSWKADYEEIIDRFFASNQIRPFPDALDLEDWGQPWEVADTLYSSKDHS